MSKRKQCLDYDFWIALTDFMPGCFQHSGGELRSRIIKSQSPAIQVDKCVLNNPEYLKG